MARHTTSTAQRSRETNTDVGHLYKYLFFFIQSKGQGHGVMLITFRVGLPPVVKPFWKEPVRHTQRAASMGILNPVLLTRNINHHSLIKDNAVWYHQSIDRSINPPYIYQSSLTTPRWLDSCLLCHQHLPNPCNNGCPQMPSMWTL